MFDINSLPEEIFKYVKNYKYKVDNIGRSDDLVIIFENDYILKISNDKDKLLNEKNKIDYLNDKLPTPKSILFLSNNDKYYYLRTCVNGDSLISDRFIKNPPLLVELLVKAIKLLRKLDNTLVPFKSSDNEGKSFVHGDLCLPNVLVDENNEISGFIDLDNSGLGDAWYDYSWVLWSLEYNLKTDEYHKMLLDKLNILFDINKYNQYIPLEYRKENN